MTRPPENLPDDSGNLDTIAIELFPANPPSPKLPKENASTDLPARTGVRTRSMTKKEKEEALRQMQIDKLRASPGPKSLFDRSIPTTETKVSVGPELEVTIPQFSPEIEKPQIEEIIETAMQKKAPTDTEFPEILSHKELSVRELISVD